MAAAVTDKFKKVKGFFSTTLASQKNSAASTMSLSDATGVPTDTGLVFTVGRVDSSGTATPSTRAIYKGTLSGTTVSNLTLTEGTDQTHAAGTVVEITWTETHVNDMVDGILEEHNQDGTHSDINTNSITNAGDISQTDGSAIDDDSGNELVKFSKTASAVNEVTVKNAATGNAPQIQATGGDTNIGLNLIPKGTGTVQVGGVPFTGAWQDWTPTWTNLTVGSGTVTAKYIQIGKTVHAFLKFVYGSGSSVSGVIGFSPPVNASSTYSDLNDSIHSSSLVLDSGSALYVCFLRWSSASLFNLYVYNTAGTYMSVTATSATLPMTWTTNDSLSVSFTYEAA